MQQLDGQLWTIKGLNHLQSMPVIKRLCSPSHLHLNIPRKPLQFMMFLYFESLLTLGAIAKKQIPCSVALRMPSTCLPASS